MKASDLKEENTLSLHNVMCQPLLYFAVDKFYISLSAFNSFVFFKIYRVGEYVQ